MFVPTRLAVAAVGVAALALAAMPSPARSATQTLARIAAVVDGEVITAQAVAERLSLTIMSAGLQKQAVDRARLRQRIVRDLIDETLQRNAARKAGITLPKNAVAEAYGRLAKRNDLAPPQLTRVLKRNNVAPESLKRRLEANLLWQRYIGQELSAQVQISDERIARYRKRLKANKGKPEYRLAEIVLSRDRAAQQAQTPTGSSDSQPASAHGEALAFARNLVEQLRGSAQFAELARQVSEAASASDGGKLGWIQPGQLASETAKRIAALDPGEVSDPIVDGETIHIYKLLDRRRILTPAPKQIELSVNRLILASDATSERISKLRNEVETCSQFKSAQSRAAVERTQALGTLKLADLPAQLQNALRPLSPGQISPVIDRSSGRELFMVCARNAPEIALPSRPEVRRKLARQALSRLARQRLDELRQEAFIDVRL